MGLSACFRKGCCGCVSGGGGCSVELGWGDAYWCG